MEVVTSRERFAVTCPCATLVTSYVAELLQGHDLVWTFGKAIVRPMHTSAMFVCVDRSRAAHELWVSATSVGEGEWTLQHSPLPDG